MAEKRRLLVIILWIAGSLIFYFGVQIGADLPHGQSNPIWAPAIGFLLFLAGWIALRIENIYQWLDTVIRRTADWFCITEWQVLCLIIGPVFTFLAAAGAGFSEKMYSPALAVISWLLGVGLFVVGSYQWGQDKFTASRATILWLIIVTVVAFLFRGTATGKIPIFLTGDEGTAGLSAAKFVRGEWNNIFVTSWYSFPSLFSFIQSIPIRIFGQTIEALRVSSAIVGALTVAAAYLCGKAMFGNRAGVFAALFLSALHFHIHFSRLGLNNIWDGLWYTIVIGALWYGWKHNGRTGYLIAGLSLGMAQYFYMTSRGLFGIITVCVLLAFLFQRRRFYQALPHLVLMLAVTVVIILPLAWFYLHYPNEFLDPIGRVSFLHKTFNGPTRVIDEPLWMFAGKQILIGMRAYTNEPIGSYYKPEIPILRPIYAGLFYLGLIFLLWCRKDSRLVLLLLWLLTFGLIGGLSESAPAAQRYVAAAPACALLVGYGLHIITEFFERLWTSYSRVIAVASYAILGFAMISESYFYFLEFQESDRVENLTSHGTIAQQLAYRLQDQPAGTQVAFFRMPLLGYYSIPSIQYLAPQVKGIDVPQPWKAFDKSLLNSDHIIFVFLPGRESEMAIIITQYPNGLLDAEKTWNNQTLFWIYVYGRR